MRAAFRPTKGIETRDRELVKEEVSTSIKISVLLYHDADDGYGV